MWTDSSFFFSVEKHEIIATLTRVIIDLTVKLPLCFTVCYMPFLCFSFMYFAVNCLKGERSDLLGLCPSAH